MGKRIAMTSPGPHAGTFSPVQTAGNMPESFFKIPLMKHLDPLKMPPQGFGHTCRQHGDPIPLPLAVSDKDLPVAKVHILGSQSNAFDQSQAGPVKEIGHDPFLILQPPEKSLHFFRC